MEYTKIQRRRFIKASFLGAASALPVSAFLVSLTSCQKELPETPDYNAHELVNVIKRLPRRSSDNYTFFINDDDINETVSLNRFTRHSIPYDRFKKANTVIKMNFNPFIESFYNLNILDKQHLEFGVRYLLKHSHHPTLKLFVEVIKLKKVAKLPEKSIRTYLVNPAFINAALSRYLISI